MRPSLQNPFGKIGFALGTALLLALPVLMGARRDQSHLRALPSSWTPVEYLYRTIAVERGDIDLLFVGGSMLDAGIDVQHVTKALSGALRRPATVEALYVTGYSLLIPYEFLKEALRRRTVKMLVVAHRISDGGGPEGHEALSHYLWNEREDSHVLADQSLRARASYYAFAVLGGPRRLLGLLRPNSRMGWTPEQREDFRKRLDTHGVSPRDWGFSNSLGGDAPHDAFTPYTPPARTVDARTLLYYGPGSNPLFVESVGPTPEEIAFLHAILELANSHGTRVVFLDLPAIDTPTAHLDKMAHAFQVPSVYQRGLSLIGISNASLFGDLSLADIHKLFSDQRHMSENGAHYFTRLITPALLAAYQGAGQREEFH